MGEFNDPGAQMGASDNSPREPDLRVQAKAPGVWEIVLNRPQRRNAISVAMALELSTALTDIGRSNDAKVIVLRGADGNFCAGADLDFLSSQVGLTSADRLTARTGLDAMFTAFAACPVPIVAVVEGYALGGGVALLSLCTYVIASPTAQLSMPESTMGLYPGYIVPFIAHKVGVNRAVFWALTGQTIALEAALAAGLVDEVIAQDELNGRVDALTHTLSARSTAVVRAAMQLRRLLKEAPSASAANEYGRIVSSIFWTDEAIQEASSFIRSRSKTTRT